jgi:membrane protein DedA with SNARE-associated domain
MQEFILTHGSYLAIIAILALTGAGLPVPEEVPTVAAGVLSSAAVGKLNPGLAFLSCLIGALLGDCIMYGIGRFLGTTYMRRHPLFARIMHEEREKQMEGLIGSHGLKVFLLARFLVGVRSPIYLAAGVMRVEFRKFLAIDAICATFVVGTFFWLSHFFGAWVGPLVRESELAATFAVLFVAVLAGIYLFVWKNYGRQLRSQAPPAGEESEAAAQDRRTSGTEEG